MEILVWVVGSLIVSNAGLLLFIYLENRKRCKFDLCESVVDDYNKYINVKKAKKDNLDVHKKEYVVAMRNLDNLNDLRSIGDIIHVSSVAPIVYMLCIDEMAEIIRSHPDVLHVDLSYYYQIHHKELPDNSQYL
jgi:hypothetical protein